MYQFYYAKKPEDFTPPRFQYNIRDCFTVTAVRPAMWEEHCLECAAPTCFGTCVHYQARSDGRCKRFENGLLTYPEEKGCCGQGVRVKFRKWGNMMTVLFPAMLSEADYAAMTRKNESLGKFLGIVNGSPLPTRLRWEGIRIPEFLRRKSLRGIKGLDNTPDAFLFHGWSHNAESYRLMVEVFEGHTPVWKTGLDIVPGENLAVITSLSPACVQAGCTVKIYPENDLEVELDILWCDFVQGTPVVSEMPADKVKCLVWDLDNTLWEGILIETENSDDLKLRPGVRETLEELDKRGILHSIASKNDHAPAMEVLEHLGIAEYFLYPQISWEPKSSALANIAKSLNIGIDALALIDDSVFERREVASVHPQVRTYDEKQVSSLLTLPEFDVPATAESAARREMYRAEERRSALLSAENTDITDFLRRCNLGITVFAPETEEEKLRCYELVVRTNQLNMSGVKYTPDEFTAVLEREGHTNFAFSCADDFGSYGIVGFGQYRIVGSTLVFTEFAMSCRVAGKFVESALFSLLLAREGCETGIFSVQKTKKNILLRNSLESIGFCAENWDDAQVCYHFTADLTNSTVVRVEGKEMYQ